MTPDRRRKLEALLARLRMRVSNINFANYKDCLGEAVVELVELALDGESVAAPARVVTARDRPEAGWQYRHRNGYTYTVVAVCPDDKGVEHVVHMGLHDGRWHVRTLENFIGYTDAGQRFVYVGVNVHDATLPEPRMLLQPGPCVCRDGEVQDHATQRWVPCKTCRPAEHELTRKVERLKDALARCRDHARAGLRQVPKTDPYNALTDIAEECRRTAEKE